ncbi:hypothetical protein C2S51_025882 [Perilla frutescens var. frutescens]|nr:hypothetical protein C2S51_025882 [Perilla frutescens var. frutescens]
MYDHQIDGGQVQTDENGQRRSGLCEGCEHIIRIPDDSVSRSEPGHGSMGVGASGGCGAMELISMGCIFLPDVDALHRPHPQDSTDYVRERIRAVWACEVIPRLARETGVHSGQLTVPRCLRWTFSRPATDPTTLLRMRFVPSRSENKKKMIANAAACCFTSAEAVIPPSARGTKAAQTPQKGRQGTGVRGPGYCSGISRSEAERSEITHSTSPACSITNTTCPEYAGAHPTSPECPTSIVEQEGTSTSAPSHGDFSVTYQLMNGIDDSSLQITYSRFRLQGPDAVIQLYFNSDRLWQSWFDELEDPSTQLKDVHMSYFLSAIVRRVWRDNGCPTMVANIGLYEALVGAWKTLHPLDPQCRQAYRDDDYRRWIPVEGLIHRIQGSDGRY